jgi:Zn-dependent peptidase ImmA (M78 family)
MKYMAEPLRRVQLRITANNLRDQLNLAGELYFPVTHFLELIMPRLCKDFYLEIVRRENFSEYKHAETDVMERSIRIREDIYYRAVSGSGRDRMTIAHEIAHYLLIVKYGVKLYRTFNHGPIVAYCDPEWQAKAFAGEIMCPFDLLHDMTIEQVVKKCGVSESAAKYALSLHNKNIFY